MEVILYDDLLTRYDINCFKVEELATDTVCQVQIPIFNTLSSLNLEDLHQYLVMLIS